MIVLIVLIVFAACFMLVTSIEAICIAEDVSGCDIDLNEYVSRHQVTLLAMLWIAIAISGGVALIVWVLLILTGVY